MDSDEETEQIEGGSKDAETSPTPTLGSERGPALPPRPTLPTLAPPFTTTTAETMSMPDLVGDRKNDTLKEIKEEGEEGETNDKADDGASLSSSARSTRFRMPSLRRRVTDSSKQQQQQQNDNASVTSSPRSIAGGAERRSRRTSEAQSEDEAASLERAMGLASAGERIESWGVGDEVVMGLE